MQQRSEETRARLLSVSEDLFGRLGYDATGVSDICSAAGVSKGAFYHHFPTKLSVFQALLREWLGQLDRQLGAAVQQTQTVPSAFLAMASGTGPVFEGAGTRARIILEFWIQVSRHPDLWQTAIAPYHQYLEQFSALLERGVQEGSLAPLDTRAASRVVIALAMGLLLQSFFDPQGASWSGVTVEGMQLLVRGLERRQS